MNLNTVLKWLGFAGLVSGALCTSFRIDPINIYLMNAGSLCYFIWAVRVKDINLMLMNGIMLASYILGLFVH